MINEQREKLLKLFKAGHEYDIRDLESQFKNEDLVLDSIAEAALYHQVHIALTLNRSYREPTSISIIPKGEYEKIKSFNYKKNIALKKVIDIINGQGMFIRDFIEELMESQEYQFVMGKKTREDVRQEMLEAFCEGLALEYFKQKARCERALI